MLEIVSHAPRIVQSGGPELAARLDIDGYAAFRTPEPEPVAKKPSFDDLFAL